MDTGHEQLLNEIVKRLDKLGGTVGGSATEATLAALLVELDKKADLTESQPVHLGLGSTSTITSESYVAITNTSILAANANRKSAVVVNESTSVMYLSYGSAASLTNYTWKLFPDMQITVNETTEELFVYWLASGNGKVMVTETT